MAFKEKAPTYQVVQWIGSNAQEVCDFWGWAQPPQQFFSKKEANGELRIGLDEHYFFTTIPVGGYVVAGPCWGNLPPRNLEVVPEDQFAERFEEIV